METKQYMEVKCTSSGNTRRFAAGTDAGFAVSLINRKLKKTMPDASHIEAVKDSEEPIAFGPNSILVNFGKGWMLQTVTDSEGVKNGDGESMAVDTSSIDYSDSQYRADMEMFPKMVLMTEDNLWDDGVDGAVGDKQRTTKTPIPPSPPSSSPLNHHHHHISNTTAAAYGPKSIT